MALDQIEIKSRFNLLATAAFALLLMNLRELIAHNHLLTRIASVIGSVLFFVVLWNLVRAYGETPTEPRAPLSNSRTAASFALTGAALLLVSRFAHLRPMLHGLANIAGWLLLLSCWTLPKSRWQAVAVAGFYAIVLSEVRLKEFAILGDAVSNHTCATIALTLLWLAVSALTYLVLSRRKPAPPASGLN
ncbi:MAG: hypothetical protein WBY53_19570 [Acidobacteriaceae bacterium]